MKLFALSLLLGLQAAATSANATNTNRMSFADELGRQVTISFFQPPPGLLQDLKGLDADKLIEVSEHWYPFPSSDVWIYFLSDSSELVWLPNALAQSISSDDNIPTGGMTRYVIDTQDGRKILLMIVFMKEYQLLGDVERRCQISNAIYREIYDFDNALGREDFAYCEQQ